MRINVTFSKVPLNTLEEKREYLKNALGSEDVLSHNNVDTSNFLYTTAIDLSDPHLMIFVAELHMIMIGYIEAYIYDDVIEIKYVGVVKDYCFIGIGSGLVNIVEQYAAKKSISTVILDMTRAEKGARAFFHGLGYSSYNEEEPCCEDDLEHDTDPKYKYRIRKKLV